jgi:hypothetical protein
VDEVTTTIQSTTQIAAALGLETSERLRVEVLAAETLLVITAWTSALEGLDIETLTAPTPSRGRSLRNLTVNVFHAIELLPAAWETGWFAWEPELDEQLELFLPTAKEIVRYACQIRDRWQEFVTSELMRPVGGRSTDDVSDSVVSSPRGELSFGVLLDAQRTHAAYHYRQLESFLHAQPGLRKPVEPVLTRLSQLSLPTSVY